MGLLDLFKKKKQEEVQIVEERELTEEEKQIWEFFKDIDDKLWQKVSYNENNFIKLPNYQDYVNKYNESLNEVKRVAQRIMDEKKKWSITGYFSDNLEKELMLAIAKKIKLNDETDLYEWMNSIDGNYIQAEHIIKQKKMKQQLEEHEKNMADIDKQINRGITNYVISEELAFNNMMEKIREDDLGEVYGILRSIGVEKYKNLSFDEFMQLPKEVLDELVEIKNTAEEIVKKNPAEFTGTPYSGEGKEAKDLFVQVQLAKKQMIIKGVGAYVPLLNFISNNISELGKMYNQKLQEVNSKVEEMAQSEEVNNELTEDVKRGL